MKYFKFYLQMIEDNKMTLSEKMLLCFIGEECSKNNHVNIENILSKLKIMPRVLRRNLSNLESINYIKRIGSNRSRKIIVHPDCPYFGLFIYNSEKIIIYDNINVSGQFDPQCFNINQKSGQFDPQKSNKVQSKADNLVRNTVEISSKTDNLIRNKIDTPYLNNIIINNNKNKENNYLELIKILSAEKNIFLTADLENQIIYYIEKQMKKNLKSNPVDIVKTAFATIKNKKWETPWGYICPESKQQLENEQLHIDKHNLQKNQEIKDYASYQHLKSSKDILAMLEPKIRSPSIDND